MLENNMYIIFLFKYLKNTSKWIKNINKYEK